MIKNPTMSHYAFLKGMYSDPYFPNHVVDQGQQILTALCQAIELETPDTLAALYILTQAATNQFNDLETVFLAHDSEIETAARECIADDFYTIAKAYGFDADIEALIATRHW